MKKICYTPIGIIHTPFKSPKGTPIQPSAGKDVEGTVEIFSEYAECLKDLDGFSHIILLFHLHLSKGWSPHVKPFMDNELRGVFSTRAPKRPNSIGLSVVRLDRIEGSCLYVRDLDIIDGSPLLDMKPYVNRFDVRENVRTGWLSENIHKLEKTRDDGRFAG